MIDIIGGQNNYTAIQKYKVIDDSPYEIDIAWLKSRTPHIAFEVQIGGNPTEAIQRLNDAKKFNFRKVILVAGIEWKDRLTNLLRYNELKHWIDIWSVKSVFELYHSSKRFYDLFTQLEESKYKEFKEVKFI